MSLVVLHQFESAVPDASVAGIVKPSHWNAAHRIVMDGPGIVGVPTVGVAANAQEILATAPGQILSYDGTTISFQAAGLALAPLSLTWSPGPVLTLTETTDNALVEVLRIQGDRVTPTANDIAHISFYMSNASGTQVEFARIGVRAATITAGSEASQLIFSAKTAGAMSNEMLMTTTTLCPFANDGLALGTTTNQWSDLFGATGFVWNLGNGNLTVTHSTGVLALTSAISATVAPWRVTNTNDNADVEVLRLDGDRATITANDQARIGMYISSSTGVQTEIGRLAWQATTVTNGAMVSQLVFYNINTTLTAKLVMTSNNFSPISNDLMALGTATVSWSDAFFATGAVINFNNGNLTLTHSADQLTLSSSSATVPGFRIFNNNDTSAVSILRLEGDRATPAIADALLIRYYLSDSAGNQDEFARTACTILNVTNGAEEGRLEWGVVTTGAISTQMYMTAAYLGPQSSGVLTLGDASHMWSSVFLNSGTKIDFNAGDVTITHAANQLTFAGATTNGYQFQDGPIRPVANDGIALGTATVSFADLFLATGAVINFNNGNVTVQHAANAITSTGAKWTIQHTSGPIATFLNSEDVASTQNVIFRGSRATPTANDNIYLTFQLQDSVGTATEFARIEVRATSVTNTTENGELRFHTAAPTLTESFRIDTAQRAVFGGTASIAVNSTPDHPPLQVHSTTLQQQAAFYRWQNDSFGAQFNLLKSKSNTIGTHTIGASGDPIGVLIFRHSDGTNFIQAATITASIDGTPGTNDMPGRLVFSTTADGASSASERMRIDNQGMTRISGGCFSRESVITKTADFTLAATENWVINNKAAATCTVTLPAASSFQGREVMFQNNQAQTLVSASSNVVPKGGGAAGTAILPATNGAWAILVSNATNWIIMLSGT